MGKTGLALGNVVTNGIYGYYTIKKGSEIDLAEFYEPVELTEEWSIRLGLTDCRIDIGNGCELELRLGKCVAVLWPSDGCTEGHNIMVPCKYVHQLQNLFFALTGQELTVTEPV